MSESQERMMAVVEPQHVDAFLAICRKWDVLATVVGEVTDGDRLIIDWHGETIVDVDAADGRPRRPGLRAPVSPGRTGRTRSRPTAASRLPRPAGGDELADTAAPAGRLAEPVRQVVGDRPVRPLRPGQLRARPARGRRHAPDRRADRPRHRPGHRLQRPVRLPRPVRRCAAGAGRGVPQRGRHRRRSRWRSPTASTSARPRTRP